MVGTAQLSLTGKTMSKAVLSILRDSVQFLIQIVQSNVLHEITGNTRQRYQSIVICLKGSTFLNGHCMGHFPRGGGYKNFRIVYRLDIL